MEATRVPQNAVERTQYELHNVYATPFIPNSLKGINTKPGATIRSQSRHHINYTTYFSTFAGYNFLPRRASLPTSEQIAKANSDEPYASNYFNYFSTIRLKEIAAQREQNEDFALYKVALVKTWPEEPQRTEHAIFALTIPGLREESPHVVLGDTLELRQLIVDQLGNFIPQEGNFVHQWSEPWTGVILAASVYGIHRATETVYLRVDGLQEHFMLNGWPQVPLPVFVNVVFPLREKDIQAAKAALVFIHDALDKALDKDRRILQQKDSVASYEQIAKDMVDLLIEDEKPINGSAPPTKSGIDTDNNDWIRRMLFPVVSDGEIQRELRKIPQRELFDPAINYEQAHAVNSICTNDYGGVPYLISGPPGTGKTKTIVETAMQLLHSHINDHILICAPSESAADVLALRLKKYLKHTQLLRLSGPWRADNEVPRELMQYTYIEDDMFTLPPFKQFMAYNIVITSCKDAAMLVEARLTNTDLWSAETDMVEAFHREDPPVLPKLHWGALLLDEAAQATELDVLSAISAVTPAPHYPNTLPQPRFVLAGDEKQLGPKTASHDPQFSQSLFARLSSRLPYASHPLSRTNLKVSSGPPVLTRKMLPIPFPPFTNLVRNYRSHPAILSIPSSLFYADTLIPEAPTPNSPLQSSTLWPRPHWPILFVPHSHPEDLERDGGGWFNAREARLACDLAAHLIRHDGVRESDIAIISPFAAQVRRIRAVMRAPEFAFWGVDIGPLEAFQGLERRVVVVATTRTKGGRFVEEDVRRGLGLIGQPRRFNVAVTRAREGLIVLGNEVALGEDECWRAFLAFCRRNGLVRGESGGMETREGKDESGEEAKVGVLERALLAKEMRKGDGGGKVLGGAAAKSGDGYDDDYEAWVESLKESMDEEGDEEEVGEEGYDDKEGEEEEHDNEDGDDEKDTDQAHGLQ